MRSDRKIYCYTWGGLAIMVLPQLVSAQAIHQNNKLNVLMLIADDMRPEMGCYGVDIIKTPNLDKLASTGTLFMNAFCNVPVSGASRASLLTGMYPKDRKSTRLNSS